jgi:hypothetical protein
MRKGSMSARALAASAFLASTVSTAFAQAGAVSQQLDTYKAVSQELLTLYERAKDKAAASSISAEIDAAVKKRDAVEAALSVAMKKLQRLHPLQRNRHCKSNLCSLSKRG